MQKKVIAYILLMIFATGQCLGADYLKPVREAEVFRRDSAGQIIPKEYVDVGDIIEEAQDDLYIKAQLREIEGFSIEVRLPDFSIGIRRNKSSTVMYPVQELLRNAVKYTVATIEQTAIEIGPIIITVRLDGESGMLLLEVENISEPLEIEKLDALNAGEKVKRDPRANSTASGFRREREEIIELGGRLEIMNKDGEEKVITRMFLPREIIWTADEESALGVAGAAEPTGGDVVLRGA